MANPEKLIKILLPKKCNWIVQVSDVEFEGSVQRYMGGFNHSNPDDTWDEYIVKLVIDDKKMEQPSELIIPSGFVLAQSSNLDGVIPRRRQLELNDVLYEVNTLMTIKAKYIIHIEEIIN